MRIPTMGKWLVATKWFKKIAGPSRQAYAFPDPTCPTREGLGTRLGWPGTDGAAQLRVTIHIFESGNR